MVEHTAQWDEPAEEKRDKQRGKKPWKEFSTSYFLLLSLFSSHFLSQLVHPQECLVCGLQRPTIRSCRTIHQSMKKQIQKASAQPTSHHQQKLYEQKCWIMYSSELLFVENFWSRVERNVRKTLESQFIKASGPREWAKLSKSHNKNKSSK